MPIEHCKLHDGSSGFRWGKSGKCYPSRKEAEKQAIAAYAAGYADDADKWITVKPNGPDAKGAPVLLGEGGIVKGGMGGKFTGKHISQARKSAEAEAQRLIEQHGHQAPESPHSPVQAEKETSPAQSVEKSEKTVLQKPERPEWYQKIRDKHDSPYWNGKFYGKPGKPEIYVSNKVYRITEEQKSELENHVVNFKKWKEADAKIPKNHTYLNVPYDDRGKAKSAGARWDADKKKWYVPEGQAVPSSLNEYLPGQEKKKPQQISANQGKKETAPVDVPKMSQSQFSDHISSLRAKRRNYQNAVNEGGEGYNPYDDQIENAIKEFNAAKTAGKTKSTTGAVHLSSRGWGDYSSAEWKGDLTRPDDEIIGEFRATLASQHDVDSPNQSDEELLEKLKKARKLAGIAMDENEYSGADDPANYEYLAADSKPPHDRVVFDRASARAIDQNGHLHVSEANISKATVNPYFGREIPGWKELGLKPNEVYQMLRHPDELKKAAETFNGSPLLDDHTPVSAWDHPYGKVVGATGNDAQFDGTYLKNSLVIWPREAIERVEDGQQKEISCSYAYEPDMTPGVYKGQAYDGVMRNIKANHVALVRQGRAGSDVVVADAKNPEIEVKMKKKYTVAKIAQLAKDHKTESLVELLDLLAKDEAEKDDDEIVDDEETEEEKAKRLKKEAEEKKAEDEEESEEKKEEKEGETEKAMDSAIAKAKAEVKAEMKALYEAQEVVFPWVGKLTAMDSASDVYSAALKLKGVNVDGIHPSAYRALCEAHMKAEAQPVRNAMDSKITNDFAARFPEAKRIRTV